MITPAGFSSLRPISLSPASLLSATRRSGQLNGCRLLVADDNRDGADTLAMVLRLRGGKVTTTYNGNAAVEAFTADPMEVVLLDLWMPGRSGWDACRAIRLLPGGTEAMIIAITGGARPEDQVRSREAGFDAHFVKPVDHTALMRMVSP